MILCFIKWLDRVLDKGIAHILVYAFWPIGWIIEKIEDVLHPYL